MSDMHGLHGQVIRDWDGATGLVVGSEINRDSTDAIVVLLNTRSVVWWQYTYDDPWYVLTPTEAKAALDEVGFVWGCTPTPVELIKGAFAGGAQAKDS